MGLVFGCKFSFVILGWVIGLCRRATGFVGFVKCDVFLLLGVFVIVG